MRSNKWTAVGIAALILGTATVLFVVRSCSEQASEQPQQDAAAKPVSFADEALCTTLSRLQKDYVSAEHADMATGALTDAKARCLWTIEHIRSRKNPETNAWETRWRRAKKCIVGANNYLDVRQCAPDRANTVKQCERVGGDCSLMKFATLSPIAIPELLLLDVCAQLHKLYSQAVFTCGRIPAPE